VTVSLRPVSEADIDLFYAHQQDPVAVWMAAFTSSDLADRAAFGARWRRILSEASIRVRTVVADETAVGLVLRYAVDGHPEVSFWLGREHWGRGHATAALALFLAELPERPVHARVAQDNVGSVAVLQHNGFVVVGQDANPAAGRQEVVREYLMALR
jgi:RimJ/RimL family protein N-acetyltransferase